MIIIITVYFKRGRLPSFLQMIPHSHFISNNTNHNGGGGANGGRRIRVRQLAKSALTDFKNA